MPICNACVLLIVTGRPKALAVMIPPKLLASLRLSAPRPATLDVAFTLLCCTVNKRLLLNVNAPADLIPVAASEPRFSNAPAVLTLNLPPTLFTCDKSTALPGLAPD